MITVRPVTTEAQAQWRDLWEGYLDFYGTALTEEQTALTWARFLDPVEPMGCLLAHDEAGRVLGFASYILHRSTWARQHYCYLEDLFVAQDARGKGAGRALIEAVAAQAREAGAGRLYWETRQDNAQGRALYDRLAVLTDFVQYRMPL